jgi:hypothetical protein
MTDMINFSDVFKSFCRIYLNTYAIVALVDVVVYFVPVISDR